MTGMLTEALALAARGWAVFPCIERGPNGKAPYTEHGHLEASTDPGQIRQWWARWPRALIGAPVPPALLVLDLDPRNGGQLDALPPLPATLTAWSGRGDGGRHFYFLRPAGAFTSTRLPRGWDLKVNGYCILPPSLHPTPGSPTGGTNAPRRRCPRRCGPCCARKLPGRCFASQPAVTGDISPSSSPARSTATSTTPCTGRPNAPRGRASSPRTSPPPWSPPPGAPRAPRRPPPVSGSPGAPSALRGRRSRDGPRHHPAQAQPGYDPEDPLALLKEAEVAGEADRAAATVAALRSMIAAGADAGVLAVARNYVSRTRPRLLPLGSYDDLVRNLLAERGTDRSDDRGPSVATQLVQIAQEFYTFGVSETGEPFALPAEGPPVVAMLRGGKTSLRALLAREYFTRTGRAPTQQALADALLVVEGLAQEADESRLYLRAAQHDGALWLDLGDHTGRAVRVTRQGWAVEDAAPVLFKRTALTGPLPEPERGGSLEDLWGWLNVAEPDRPLVAVALVSVLFSEQPHVVLAIFGEQGTGKTTAVKVLVLLLDPGPAPVRKPPRDSESWVTAAAGSWVVGLDNLSEIQPWLSDSLCRASTGDGDVRRKLYTDGDYAVFSFRRCIIFDAIDVGALEPDLADRALPVTLALIPDDDRRDEESFWPDWRQAHPRLLGAVLDLASAVLRRLPDVTLARKPRMADYARILAAVDAELGTSALDRYASQAANLAAEGLSGDSLAARIIAVIAAPFEGTSAQLRAKLTPAGLDAETEDWKPPKDWPANARDVTGKLRRLAPAFRKTGWTVTELPPGHANAIRWHISPLPGRTR